MKRIIFFLVIYMFASLGISRGQSNPYTPWLRIVNKTGVPQLDSARVIPGSVYYSDNRVWSFQKKLQIVQSLNLVTSQVNIPSQFLEMSKSSSLLATILRVGKNVHSTLKIKPTTITCVGITDDTDSDADDLVYRNTDFKKSLEPQIANKNPILFVTEVCYATQFSLDSASSSDFIASLNNKNDVKPCSDDSASKALAEEMKSDKTIGDLVKSLSAPWTAASLVVKNCQQEKQTIELDSKVPVAIAMKTWSIIVCGTQRSKSYACDSNKDPNKLEYFPSIDPEFY